jgi:hypothetical protein
VASWLVIYKLFHFPQESISTRESWLI